VQVLLYQSAVCGAVMTDQVGYMSSWSAYNMYRKQHPQRPDPLLEFRQQVMDALEAQVSYGTSVLSSIPPFHRKMALVLYLAWLMVNAVWEECGHMML